MRKRKIPKVGDRIDTMWNDQYLSGDVVRVSSDFIEVSLDSPRQPMYHEQYMIDRGQEIDLNTLWIHKQSAEFEIIAYVEDLEDEV